VKIQELKKLQPGSEIKHKRYGVCELREVTYCRGDFFGAVVRPKTDEGKALLAADCGCNIDTLMEDSLLRLAN